MAKKKGNIRDGLGLTLRRIIAYIVLIFITALCLCWFLFLLINATRSNGEMTKGFTLIPSKYLIKNWVNLKNNSLPIVRGLINSLIVSTSCAVLSTYFSSMTAYAIHTYQFKMKNFMYTFILMVMMIPSQVTALGFLRLIRQMKIDNSFLPLIIPTIAAPVTFFYIKQYMDSILPLSLVEAARIDGSGEFRTFNQIVIPIMKPAIAVQAIFTFVSNWNNFFMPTLILRKPDLKTLPILIAELKSKGPQYFDLGQQYVMIAFSIFPVVVVYLILSRYIVQGVTLGSVKG